MTLVAIDGPAGAGKSTVGRAVAAALGWKFVDTGAMYRAVALAALARGIPVDDGEALRALAESLHIDAGSDRTVVDGEDVTESIRRADVTGAVSTVSSHAGVREVLVQRQRAFAARRDVVMEGRDIGATVAPDADVKVFLTAALGERARRRAEQLGLGKDEVTLEELESSLAARDAADAERAASPLRRPPDALVIDSTDHTFEEVVDLVLRAAREANDGG